MVDSVQRGWFGGGVALLKCEDCGKDISSKAHSCPSCGCPVPNTNDKNKVRGMDQNPTNPALRTSTMAIISLVSGLMCIPILPIVLGHLARGEVRKSNNSIVGSGMALAGLILGYLPFAIAIISLGFILIPAQCASDGLNLPERKIDSAEGMTVADQDKELEFREDGLWYETGSVEPFSGAAVSYHEDGKMKSRTKVKDGKAYGLIEEWDKNGSLRGNLFKDKLYPNP